MSQRGRWGQPHSHSRGFFVHHDKSKPPKWGPGTSQIPPQRILPPAPGPDSDNVKKSKSKSKSKKSPAIVEDSEERDSISSPSSPERSASGFDSELVFTTANER
ncbi:hypothetical protein B0H10DRAFT_531405 [Mycena sp. CBHHK59/15]|nr:hypothetical protein B0H10DRAFT_531405 [Mycena sp. CBHHK59/15]